MHSAYIPTLTPCGNLMTRIGPCAVWAGLARQGIVWAWLYRQDEKTSLAAIKVQP